MPDELITRFVMGAGGFLGEVSLKAAPEEALALARPGRPLWFLTDLFVHPLRRKDGWGRSLMRSAVGYADRKGADLWLYARPHGRAPRMSEEQLAVFYFDHGFVPIPPVVYPGHIEMVRCAQSKR